MDLEFVPVQELIDELKRRFTNTLFVGLRETKDPEEEERMTYWSGSVITAAGMAAIALDRLSFVANNPEDVDVEEGE